VDITPWLAAYNSHDGGPRNRRERPKVLSSRACWFPHDSCRHTFTIVISFTRSVPTTFIDVLAGVAMLSVIANNFTQAFSSPLKMGALFALMTTLSGITLFNIGSTLWAIIFGTIISLLLERDAYLQIVKNTKY